MSRGSEGHEVNPNLVMAVNFPKGTRIEAPRMKTSLFAGAYAAFHILLLFEMSFISFYKLTALWAIALQLLRLRYHTQKRHTLRRTHLDEGSVRRRNFYLTTHNIPVPGGIRTRNPSKLAAANSRLRRRGHGDRSF